MSVHMHFSITAYLCFTKFLVHVTFGHGSLILFAAEVLSLLALMIFD